MKPQKPVIFFDGVCGLCNAFVDFVFQRDLKHEFLFAPLQGKTAKELLPSGFTAELNTIVLWQDGQIKIKATAATEIFSRLGGLLALLATGGKVLPNILQIKIYDLVAKYRYRLFGKREVCRLPTAVEAPYFLD